MSEQPKFIKYLSKIKLGYQLFAVLFLTTIIFLGLVEVAIGLTYTIARAVNPLSLYHNYYNSNVLRSQLPYYVGQPWGEEFWSVELPKVRFQPYSLWRTEEFTSDL